MMPLSPEVKLLSLLLVLAVSFGDYRGTVLTDFCQDVALESSEAAAVTLFPLCSTVFTGGE